MQGPLTPLAYDGVCRGVVPDQAHRLLERPCHPATPLNVAALQMLPDQLPPLVIKEVPHSHEIERRIGSTEAASVEDANQTAGVDQHVLRG